ncbi:hypothetical protein EZS27_001083 [termite gut metagenome]|uniref:CRP-like cAMP-activated global transcriptional regulator n=1 Tax=termite gut metagenome TaxID=433724 RepID=A0A5J4T280_9ZZZZ
MYNTLLRLPLFQGICREDLTAIIEKVKLNFLKYEAGKQIVRSGERCDKLIFLLSGEITSSFYLKKDFVFVEYIQAPYPIEPYSLFGMDVYYTSSYTAYTDVDVLTIEKSFVINELFKYEIFRFNYVNIISNRTQILYSHLWKEIPGSTEDKIIRFLKMHLAIPNGKKSLKIKMTELAWFLNETRLNVSKALNVFQEKGLLTLHRKEIVIPKVELLIATGTKQSMM